MILDHVIRAIISLAVGMALTVVSLVVLVMFLGIIAEVWDRASPMPTFAIFALFIFFSVIAWEAMGG